MSALDTAPATALGGVGLRPRRHPVRRPVVVIAGAVLALLVVAAIAPQLFTSASPTDTDVTNALAAPSAAHWFGTDQLGRDVLCRILYGARPSLLIGLGATAFALAGGIVLGLAAALSGRVGDQLLMRLADVMLSLPPLLLALLAVVILGTGTVNAMIAVAIAFTPGFARIVRAEALVVRRSGYVEAAAGLGRPRWVLILRHILPNALGPLLVVATVGIGMAMIAASSLSFLGLGTQPPAPEWGAMLSAGRDFLQTAWWIGVFPGAAVTVAVIAINIVGRFVQERLTRRAAR